MRALKIALVLLALILVPFVGAATYVVTLEPERVKGLVGDLVSRATGRTFVIEGPLAYELSWKPWIRVEGVRMANADWGRQDDMLRLGAAELKLDLDHLFDGVIVVESLALERAELLIERHAEKGGNWPLADAQRPQSSDQGLLDGFFRPPVIQHLKLADVRATMVDAAAGSEHNVAVELIDLRAPSAEAPVMATVKAEINGKRVDVVGTLPAVAELGAEGALLPFEAAGSALGHPVKVAGKARFVIADGAPVSVKVQDLAAQLFNSDFAGSVSVDLSGRRPALTAELRSAVVDVAPIREAIAAGRRTTTPPQTKPLPARDLPAAIRAGMAETLPVELLSEVDFDLGLDIGMVKGAGVSLSAVSARVSAKAGRVEIGRLHATYAATPLEARATLDGRDGRTLRAIVEAAAKDAEFGGLLAEWGVADLSARGAVEVKLQASGRTVGDLLASAHLEARFDLPTARLKAREAGEARLYRAEGVAASLKASGGRIEPALAAWPQLLAMKMDGPLPLAVLDAVEADLDLRAREVASPEQTIPELHVTAALKKKRLTVEAPNLALARASLALSAAVSAEGPVAKTSIAVRWPGVDLTALASKFGRKETVSGHADVDLDLSGSGRTLAAILASLDGRLSLAVREASVDIPANAGDPPVSVRIERLSLAAASMGEPLKGEVAAEFGGERVALSGSFPSAKALRETSAPLPLSVVGKALGQDVRLAASLRPVWAGERLASLAVAGLDAQVGASDIAGDLLIGFDGARPRIDAVAKSRLIDLAPFLGADRKEDAASASTMDEPLPVDRLGLIDGALKLDAAEVRLKGATIRNLALDAALEDRRLTLRRSTGLLNEGAITMSGTLDARPAKPALDLEGTWKDAHFGEIARTYLESEAIEGRGDARIRLAGAGATWREVSGSLDGVAAMVVREGTIARGTWELIATDLATSLLPSFGDSKAGKLNCMAGRLDLKGGKGDLAVFLVDSDRVTVGGTGSVDLKSETLDLRITPKPKDPSIVSLSTPLLVKGPIAGPSVVPDPAALAKDALKSGAAALALGPAALLLPFLSLGTTADPCPTAIALAEGREPPPAPAGSAPAQQPSGNGLTDLPGKAIKGIFEGLKKVAE